MKSIDKKDIGVVYALFYNSIRLIHSPCMMKVKGLYYHTMYARSSLMNLLSRVSQSRSQRSDVHITIDSLHAQRIGLIMRYLYILLMMGCDSFGFGSGEKVVDSGEFVSEPSTSEPGYSEPESSEQNEDLDQDGFRVEDGDCNDEDPNVSPSALDLYGDGVDQNCDGMDGIDGDKDGFASVISGGNDCNDQDSLIHPNANEYWYDGVDQNCDEQSDYDQDGDGFDSSTFGGNDCNDQDSLIHPNANEYWYDGVDQNCDEQSDYDQDGDGVDIESDCNDENATIAPNATDTPDDGIDQDCDGEDATSGNPNNGGGGTTVCDNTCIYAGDNVCDDGGTDASFDDCAFGTDCGDCGPRDPCQESCTPWNTPAYSNNGVCEDGGPNSSYGTCDRGTDCLDCGSY